MIIKQIDEGGEGAVYDVQNEDGVRRILKIAFERVSPRTVDNELCNQAVSASLGFSPKIVDYWQCLGEIGC